MESPLTPITSDILVIVTSTEGTSSHPLAQYTAHSATDNSDCESPSPQTRSDLQDSRRRFFQDLEVTRPVPSSYV